MLIQNFPVFAHLDSTQSQQIVKHLDQGDLLASKFTMHVFCERKRKSSLNYNRQRFTPKLLEGVTPILRYLIKAESSAVNDLDDSICVLIKHYLWLHVSLFTNCVMEECNCISMFSAVPKIDNLCKLTTFNMLIAFSVFYSSLSFSSLYILISPLYGSLC